MAPRLVLACMHFCLVLSVVLAAHTAAAAATVKSVSPDGRVALAPAPAAGTVFEVTRGDDFLGFLAAEKGKQGVAVRPIAGRAEPGAQVAAIERPAIRVGLLGGPEAERVKKELAVLCPGRVVELAGPGELRQGKVDAVVITSSVPEQVLRRFVEAGGTAIVDLAPYAAWEAGAKPTEVASSSRHRVEVVGSSEATRGLAIGQSFQHFGTQGKRRVARCLDAVRPGGKVLLALLPSKKPVAVEHRIGKGRLLALDLLAPNGEPGYDSGSVLKWLLPGNLIARSARYVKALSTRLKYPEYMKLQQAVAARVAGKWACEPVGEDSGGRTIWRFRMGALDRPTFLIDGAIHSGEWVNPYLLLDLIEYLANVPEADTRTRWVLRHFSVVVIPMLSGSLRQESSNGCDLNRNFDFRWDDYTKGYGWRAGRALKLRGTAPFSEPEARVVRDHIWNHPIIGYANTHMHGVQHGAMFIAPHSIAGPDRTTFDAACKVMAAHLRDRFLWKGPSQLIFRRSAHDGRTVPYAGNWAAYQGLWSVTTELVGGGDHSLQEKELGFEGLLAFMHAVGADYAAGKRTWLGCPRVGFARPGGYKDATALVFARDGKHTITYRTNRGRGTLCLPLPSAGCRLSDQAGTPVQWKAEGDACLVPMDTRRLFFECGKATQAQVLDALKRATFEKTGGHVLWVPTAAPTLTVAAPETDAYAVWAHVHGGRAKGKAVGVSRKAESAELRATVAIPADAKGWRWVRGERFQLRAGENAVRLHGMADASGQPNADMLCLSSNRRFVPTDAMAQKTRTNLLKNPGFEEGLGKHWKPYGKLGTLERTLVHGGTQAYRSDSDKDQWMFIGHRVPAEPNTHYQVSFWARTGGASKKPFYARLYVHNRDAADKRISHREWTFGASPDGFTRHSVRVTTCPNTRYLLVKVGRHWGGTWVVYDDLEVLWQGPATQ